MRDAFTDFANDPSTMQQPAAPVRASFLALFGRLGVTSGWRGRAAGGAEPLAHAFDHDLVLPDVSETAPAIASRAQIRLRRLRDEARAAYASVIGSHDAALDAALAVIEAEWRADAGERDRYGEALKAIRLYSGDVESRQLARRALEGRPDMPRACGGRHDA